MRKAFKNQEIESTLQIVLCHVLNTLDVDGKRRLRALTLAVKGRIERHLDTPGNFDRKKGLSLAVGA
jgi:hypothetical protein